MKKRYLIFLAICSIILIVYSQRKVLLAEIYPEISNGEYHATISWENRSGEVSSYKVSISDEKFRSMWETIHVKKHPKLKHMPVVAFEIRLIYKDVAYSIVVGGDNTISVAQLENLNKTRKFWRDCDGKIFYSLYKLYLDNGGIRIPEIETYLSEN